MIETAFLVAAILLMVNVIFCLYRAAVGPTPGDRVVAINMITSKTIAVMALVSFMYHEELFLDVAITYTLIGYTATICVAKYLELKRL